MRRLDAVLLRPLSLLAIVCGIASLAAPYHAVGEWFRSLTVQQWIGSFGLMTLAWILRRSKWVYCLAAIVLIHSYHLVAGFGTAAPVASNLGADSIRIATINVLTSNRRYDAIIGEIERTDADVIAIFELGDELESRLRTDLRHSYPHQVLDGTDRGNFGLGIISRLPLKEARLFPLAEGPLAVEARVGPFHLFAAHPIPPKRQVFFRRRNDQLRDLIRRIDDESASKTIVMGDFNVTPWSPHFRDLVAEHDLRRAGGIGSMLRPTWYAKPTWPMGLAIDHILIGQGIRAGPARVGEAFGSDHRSVCVGVAVGK